MELLHETKRGSNRSTRERVVTALRVERDLVVVCAVFAACLLWGWTHTPGTTEKAAALRYVLCWCAAPAVGAVALARERRGRTALVDALHAVAWIHPWQLGLLLSGHVLAPIAASAAASAVVLGASVGWRRAFDACARLLPRVLNQRVIGFAILSALVWITHNILPTRASGVNELDGAWIQGVAWALDRGRLEGVDWLFTAGPLGGLHWGGYERGLYWTTMIVWEGGVKIAMAVLLTTTVLRLRGVAERALYCVLIVLVPMENDAWVYLALLAATAWILDRPAIERPILWFGAALFALLALVKFTALMLCGALIVLVAFAIWRTSSMKRALVFLGGFSVIQLAVWLLAGQSLTNVIPFLVTSWDLSSGYNDAMSLPCTPREMQALGYTALGAGMVALGHALARPRDAARLAGSVALVAAYVLAFKAAFTRGDGYHPKIYFSFAAMAPFVLGDPLIAGFVARACTRIGRFVGLAAAVAGLCFAHGLGEHATRDIVLDAVNRATWNFSVVRDLSAHRKRCEEGRAQRQRDEGLPRVRAAVGDATIDMVGWQVGVVLLHDLNWKPRLSMQSYCAYTAPLQRANADLYRSADAPEYVLFNLESIDSRYPMIDDNEVLQVLLRDYRPLFVERGYLLMHREPRASPPPPRETLVDRTVKFGEKVDLAGYQQGCQLLVLDIEYTLRGKLWFTLYGAPPLFMDCHMSDGNVYPQRIVPGMMRSGVITGPFMTNLETLLRWSHGERLAGVNGIQLKPEKPWMYASEMRVRLIRADDLQPIWPPSIELQSESAAAASGAPPPLPRIPLPEPVAAPVTARPITPAPFAFEGDRPARLIDGPNPLLVVHTPSRVHLAVPPGHFTLRGRFGLAPGARRDGCAVAVTVGAILVEGERRTTLLERTLDTARREDLVEASFEVAVDTAAPAWIWLETGFASGDQDCAWTFWKQVRLE